MSNKTYSWAVAEEDKCPKKRMTKEGGGGGEVKHKSHTQNYLLSSVTWQLDLEGMLQGCMESKSSITLFRIKLG